MPCLRLRRIKGAEQRSRFASSVRSVSRTSTNTAFESFVPEFTIKEQAIADLVHCFERIDNQVEDHLLQLNAIRRDLR